MREHFRRSSRRKEHAAPPEETPDIPVFNRELQRIAARDKLTDVATRDFFFAALAAQPDRQGMCLMVDIDHFKSINDRYGHFTGDRCIQRCAQLLQQHAKRPYDVVARFGGQQVANQGVAQRTPAVNDQYASIARLANQLLEARIVLKTFDRHHRTAERLAGTIRLPIQTNDHTDMLSKRVAQVRRGLHLPPPVQGQLGSLLTG